MTHTRYTAANIALLIAGGGICLTVVFLSVMTSGFAADEVHDFKTGAFACALFAALLTLPAYLAMFRWCRIGQVAIWLIAGVVLLGGVLAGMLSQSLFFVLSLIAESIIFTAITTNSQNSSHGADSAENATEEAK